MSTNGLLLDSVIFLGAAVATVPIAKRLGLGSVLGYLAGGILIGPWGIGLITEAQTILHFAEFGVVLLLFLIGLELNPRLLWDMRRPILGTGGLQVLASTALLFGLALLAGVTWQVALVAGMGLALSSTAIALQILQERNLADTAAGRTGFSVLLFQDMAIVPMLAVLPLLASGPVDAAGGPTGWLAVAQALGAIAAVALGGHFLLRPVLRFMVGTGLREISTAFTLLLVMGVALLMDSVGLSMALGTFLAGVLLADSEYRHTLEADIEPFKGLLMGLFFIAVGMSVDFGLLLASPVMVLSITAVLLLTKGAVLWLLARQSGLPVGQRPMFTFLLAQGGEFAFVLFSTATSLNAMPAEIADLLILAVTLSMLTTPLLMLIEDRVIEPRYRRLSPPEETPIPPQECSVIIAGFGRFGQIVGRLLHAHHIPTTLLDHDPDHIEMVGRFGFNVFFGDAARLDLLHAAGADQARVLVIALDDPKSTLKLAELARSHFPQLKIIARAWDLNHLFELTDIGIEEVYRETFDTALAAGEAVLRDLGYGAFEVHRAGKRFRAHDIESLEHIHLARQESVEHAIDAVIRARDELKELYAEDEIPLEERETEWN